MPPTFSAGSASVNIVPDFSNAQRLIGSWFGSLKDVTVKVTPELDNTATGRIQQQLSGIKAQKINVEIDADALGRSIVRATDAVSGFTATLGAVNKLVGPTFLSGAVGGLLSVVSASGAAGGALLLLPAALAAVAVPMAVVKIGTQGMGDAFKAVASGDAAKLEEALAKLAPAAREFVGDIQRIQPAFKEMQLEVQQQLFTGLGNAVGTLAERWLPTLTTGLSGIATELRQTALQTIATASSFQSIQSGATIFANIKETINVLNPTLGNLFRIFMDIAAVGSSFLPGLASGFANAAAAAADWVAKARETGQLTDIISTALTTIKQLAGLLLQVGATIMAILKPAYEAGASLIQIFTELFAGLNRIVSLPMGQASLSSFFQGVAAAAQALLPAALAIADVFINTVLPAFGELLRVLGPIVATVLVQFADLLRQIAPLIPSAAQAVGALVSALTPLIPIVGEIVSTLLPIFIDLVARLAPYVAELASALGAALLQALNMITPILPQIVDAFFRVLDALMPLVPIVLDLALSAFPPLLGIIERLVPVIASIVEAVAPVLAQFLEFIGPILPPLIGFLGGLAVAVGVLALGFKAYEIIAIAVKVAQIALNIAMSLNPIGLVVIAIGLLVGALVLAWNESETFRRVVTEAWEAVKAAALALKEYVVEEFNKVKAELEALGQFLTVTVPAKWEELKTAVSNKVTEMKDAVVNKVTELRDNFVNKVTELSDNIANKFIELKDNVVARVTELRDNFVNKVIEMKDNVVARVTELRDNFVNKVTELKDNIVARVTELRDNFVNKVTELRENITTRVTELRDNFVNKVTELRENITARITELRDRFVEKVTELRENITARVTELRDRFVEKVTELRENITARITELRDRFVEKVTELRENITARITELRDRFVDKVSELRDTIIERITNLRDRFVEGVTNLRDRAVEIITNLRDGIVDRITGMRDRAVEIATDLRDKIVGKYDELRQRAVDIFERMVASVKEKWDAIKAAAAIPINFVINSVWNNGIKKGWDIVATALGIGKAPSMDPIPGYAAGGPLRGRYRGPVADNLLGIVDNEYPVKLNTDEWVHPVMSRRKYGDQFMHAVQTGAFPAELAKGFAEGFAGGGLLKRRLSERPMMDPAWVESLAWNDGREKGAIRGFAYGGVMQHVAWSGDEIQRLFGRMPGGIGGVGARPGPSDHPKGLALDFMTLTNQALGDRVANHIYANAAQHSLKYQIWKQRIRYPGGGWTGMADRGSITANHFDHPHVSYMAKAGQVGTGGGTSLNPLDLIKQAYESIKATLLGSIADAVEGPARGFIDKIASPPPQWMDIPRGVGNKILDQVMTWMRGKAESKAVAESQSAGVGAVADPEAASAPGFTGPAAVAQWSDEVGVVLGMLGRPMSELGAVLRRIGFESGGNPRAINNTDINAVNGVNSRGLMQVIPPTFAAYRSAALPNDIYHPIANIFAGSNYAIKRYGSLAAIDPLIRPKGYDRGGWLPPGLNSVWNGSGRPEPVLTASESDGLLRWRHMNAAQAATRGGGDNRLMGDVHIHAEQRRAGEIMDELWHRMRVARRGGVYATSSVSTVG